MSEKEFKTVRKVHLEDVSLLLKIEKDNGGIKKEIRHSLDSQNHGKFDNVISYVHDDYKLEVLDRGDYLEIYVKHADIVIQLNKFTAKYLIESASKSVLEMSENVLAVGGFNIREHYLQEPKWKS